MIPNCLQAAVLDETQKSCLLCAAGYYLYDKACYTTCPLDTRPHEGTKSCQRKLFAFLLIQLTFFHTTRMPIRISLCKKNIFLFHSICLIFLRLGRVRCLHKLLSCRILSYCKLYLHRMFDRVRHLHRNSKQ